MTDENASQEVKSAPVAPQVPGAAVESNSAPAPEYKAALDAWESTKLLDSCVGADTEKRKKVEIVEIIHFHKLAFREYRNSPERKRLACQTTMRKIRRILPHVSEEKLQPLLNATVEQLTPSGFLATARSDSR